MDDYTLFVGVTGQYLVESCSIFTYTAVNVMPEKSRQAVQFSDTEK